MQVFFLVFAFAIVNKSFGDFFLVARELKQNKGLSVPMVIFGLFFCLRQLIKLSSFKAINGFPLTQRSIEWIQINSPSFCLSSSLCLGPWFCILSPALTVWLSFRVVPIFCQRSWTAREEKERKDKISQINNHLLSHQWDNRDKILNIVETFLIIFQPKNDEFVVINLRNI